MCYDRTERILVQTLLGIWTGSGTYTQYRALSQNLNNSVINIESVRLSLQKLPKVGRRVAKQQIKKYIDHLK